MALSWVTGLGTYEDGEGQKRFKGTKELRSSQSVPRAMELQFFTADCQKQCIRFCLNFWLHQIINLKSDPIVFKIPTCNKYIYNI